MLYLDNLDVFDGLCEVCVIVTLSASCLIQIGLCCMSQVDMRCSMTKGTCIIIH